MKSKEQFIAWVESQTNIKLTDDSSPVINKRNVIYAKISKRDINVLYLLAKNKIRYEQHIHDYYFIFI